ncbi:MAG: hypothetical protein PHO48_04960 [Candidatus Gracilibacteria bacterium]|nr:hypothetical protein [Candidatus Gracilibacteria bacterium]MDD5179392.1 hypothetical protein [Candidatus Gracilibacteria bacterium]
MSNETIQWGDPIVVEGYSCIVGTALVEKLASIPDALPIKVNSLSENQCAITVRSGVRVEAKNILKSSGCTVLPDEKKVE